MTQTQWQNRIVGSGEEAPDQLLANPKNWRIHPQHQQQALEGVLDDVGWVQQVVVNRRNQTLIDGHLRVSLALRRNEPRVPVVYVDLSEAEEALILATLDPLAAMAATDAAQLDALLREVETDNAAVMQMLEDMAQRSGVLDDPEALPATTPDMPAEPDAPRASLADRFIVPPFSVLDARQGYWQTRKQAWIALGIQSELGRGENALDMSATMAGISDPEQRAAWNEARRASPRHTNDLLGFSEQARSHYNASPGGSQDAATRLGADGKTQRGDGRGRGLARTFGQDLMRGEHVVGETASLKGGLTHGTTIHHTDGSSSEGTQSGTSIFDPVLCELVYRWFTPAPGAAILDPFAGGSVRGIVAAKLGYAYTGIDLRPEQIAANEAQAAALFAQPAGDTVTVKVSAKMARLRFNGCDPEYIRTTCHASCCQSSTSPTGTVITIHPSEVGAIEARGGVVKDGLLQPRAGERRCPFKTADHLCGLHFTPDKPFGCIASPFTLNASNTLIVRNRYKLLKCYEDGKQIPAYHAFRASLDLIFGQDEAQRLVNHFDAGGGDTTATMPRRAFAMLKENDDIKHGRAHGDMVAPRWITGDSRDVQDLAPGRYDLIFSCPPYADLEVYSDDPRDLSTLDYAAFLESYRHIIAASVTLLHDNRFACFVVGDVRDSKGFYRNFVSDTIAAFQDAGMTLYNEAILVTAVGSLPIRVGKQFEGYRKLGKTHQNVLVFYKGDPKAIKSFGSVEAGEMSADEGGDSNGGDLGLDATIPF